MRAEDPPDGGDDTNKFKYIVNSIAEVPNGLMYALGIGSPEPGLHDGKVPGTGKTILSNNLGDGTHAVPEAEQGSDGMVDMKELYMSWAGVNVKKVIPNFVYMTDKITDAAVNMKKASKNLPDLSFEAHGTDPGSVSTIYKLNDSTEIIKTVTTVRPQNDPRGSQASMELDTITVEKKADEK
jgi:hypothetical protein